MADEASLQRRYPLASCLSPLAKKNARKPKLAGVHYYCDPLIDYTWKFQPCVSSFRP